MPDEGLCVRMAFRGAAARAVVCTASHIYDVAAPRGSRRCPEAQAQGPRPCMDRARHRSLSPQLVTPCLRATSTAVSAERLAHQGPLPRLAARGRGEALAASWRHTGDQRRGVHRCPAAAASSRWAALSARRRNEHHSATAPLVGLQALANGAAWRQGDEILVLADELPCDRAPRLVDRVLTA